MKKLLSIALLVLLQGCGEPLVEPTRKGKYLSGTWTFLGSTISGTVELARIQDFQYGTVTGTTFRINGTDYTNNLSSGVTLIARSDWELSGLDLATDYGYGAYISFREGTYTNVNTLTYRVVSWGTGCDEYCEQEGEESTIVLKRQ